MCVRVVASGKLMSQPTPTGLRPEVCMYVNVCLEMFLAIYVYTTTIIIVIVITPKDDHCWT